MLICLLLFLLYFYWCFNEKKNRKRFAKIASQNNQNIFDLYWLNFECFISWFLGNKPFLNSVTYQTSDLFLLCCCLAKHQLWLSIQRGFVPIECWSQICWVHSRPLAKCLWKLFSEVIKVCRAFKTCRWFGIATWLTAHKFHWPKHVAQFTSKSTNKSILSGGREVQNHLTKSWNHGKGKINSMLKYQSTWGIIHRFNAKFFS